MFRTGRAPTAEAPQIDMAGGMFSAGIIRGVSVITSGEALGHEAWADAVFLQQVDAAITAAGDQGIKSRFTHPGMSSDGLGRHLGRLNNSRIEGDRVLADLHFAKSAHETPDGNLAEYVALLVGEDPSAAGLSIVFNRDFDAEEAFAAQGKFDAANTNEYTHFRLKELRAADVVDEPAANPDGMFDSMPIAREVDTALAYALGLSDETPNEQVLGVDVDRAAAFLSRFFTSRGLEIVTKETSPEPQQAPAVTRESFAAELSKYVEKFGAENGTKWFTSGKTYEQAMELHCEAMAEQLKQERDKSQELADKLASLELGEKEPLPVAGESGKKKNLAALMSPSAN